MQEICTSGSVRVAPCKRMHSSRLRWRPRQSLASSRAPSLAGCPATGTAKRRQGGRQAGTQVNGQLAPKSIVVETADPIPLWGRQNRWVRCGECPEVFPGFVPPACRRGSACEQGRSTGFKLRLVGPDEPAKRGGSDAPVEVRLADSTPRPGEPVTWGSGQRRWMRFQGDMGSTQREDTALLCKEKTRQSCQRDWSV